MHSIQKPSTTRNLSSSTDVNGGDGSISLNQDINARVSSVVGFGSNTSEKLIAAHFAKNEVTLGLSLAKRLAKQNRQQDSYLALIAVGHYNLSEYEKAAKWAEKALRLNRLNFLGNEVMAKLLFKRGRYVDSISRCDTILRNNPNNTETMWLKATNHFQLHNYKEAIAIYQRVLSIEPNHGNSLNYLMLCAVALNDSHLIKETAFSLIKEKTHVTMGYFFLAQNTKFHPEDPNALKLLKALLDQYSACEDDKWKSKLASCIARAAEQLKQYDLAFKFFGIAANTFQKWADYEYNQEATYQRKLISLLDYWSEDPSKSGKQLVEPEKHPILIVGMPRSGTSLTEQILASHSGVFGGGELPDLKDAFIASLPTQTLQEPTPKRMIELAYKTAGAYMKSIIQKYGETHHIVDKMPVNYTWSAFVLAAIPEARLIFTRRDPMATLWSAYKTNFDAAPLGYTNNLASLIDYYEQSLKFMVRHKELFGDRVYIMNYERLTEDQENQTRLLLDHCGLDFEVACLNFHKNTGGIYTASSKQVAKPMYKGSSQAWRKYEKHLLPYAEILDELDRKYGIDSL